MKMRGCVKPWVKIKWRALVLLEEEDKWDTRPGGRVDIGLYNPFAAGPMCNGSGLFSMGRFSGGPGESWWNDFILFGLRAGPTLANRWGFLLGPVLLWDPYVGAALQRMGLFGPFYWDFSVGPLLI
ncbi:hypothetical protein U1Q18_046906 [Sarracenia purpurea var. burkii]